MKRSRRLKLSIEQTRRLGLYIKRPRGLTLSTANGLKKMGRAFKLYARRNQHKPSNKQST